MSTLFRVIDTGEIIQFHAELSSGGSSPATVAEHPVSARTPSSEHVQRGRRTWEFSLLTTESPFGRQLTLDDQLGLDLETEVFAFFERNRTRYFDIVSTREGIISPVAVSDFGWKHDGRRMCSFDVKVVEVRYAEAQRTKIPPRRSRKKGTDTPKPETTFTPDLLLVDQPLPTSKLFETTANSDAVSYDPNDPVGRQLAARARTTNAANDPLSNGRSRLNGRPQAGQPANGVQVRNQYLVSGPNYKLPTAQNNFVQLRTPNK